MTARLAAGTTTGTVRIRPLRELGPADVERWWSLAARATEPNPFTAPAVALAAARHLPGGADALLLSVERDGEMTFALPVVRRRAAPHLPLPVLATWQAHYPPLATPLLDPAHATTTWQAVRASLPHGPHRAAWLLIDPMPTTGPAATTLAGSAGHTALVETDSGARGAERDGRRGTGAAPRAVMMCTGGPRVLEVVERAVAYRDGEPVGASEKTRKNLAGRRRKMGRMAGDDAKTFRIAPGEVVPDSVVEGFLELEASGWKGREGTALACRGETAGFFRELVREQAARGGVEVVGIRCGERLVAATFNLVSGDGLFFYKIAYDEEFRTASPGRILMADNLDAFAADPALEFADSCADPGASLSNQVLHDRRPVGTVLVPAAGAPAAAVTGAALLVRAARRRLRALSRPRRRPS